MPKYTLIYFGARGRAELCRFIFAQAGVEYEDKRVAGEEWQKLKPNTPYGSLPVLEVDGKMLAGSSTIARYLAEEFGLAGSDAFENAQLDSISGVVEDLGQQLYTIHFEKDEARKAELKKEAEEKHFPRYLGPLSKLVTDNSSGWILGPKLTWADLKVAIAIDMVGSQYPEVLTNFPTLAKLKDTVWKLPNIAKWVTERPESAF